MPKLELMGNALIDYAVKTTIVANDILTASAELGAETMQKFIEADSPTGTRWHERINKKRGNKAGARVETGTMLQSVMAKEAQTTSSNIFSKFGWDSAGPEGGYFAQQDDGSYRSAGVGMGLLNKAGGRDMIALITAREDFKSRMRKAGFRESVLF